MAHILSQEEVDALLRNFQEEDDESGASAGGAAGADAAEGGPSQPRVSRFDFRRPNRISKDQLRFLQTLHSTYAFSYAGVLSGYLRTLVEIGIGAVEQYSYGEWIKGLRDSTCLFPFSMSPLDGSGVIEMEPRMALSFVDRLLGGRGEVGDEERELTHLETTVVSRLIEDGLKMLGDAWAEVVQFQPALQGHERQPQLLRLLADTEPVIVVGLDLRLKARRGRMTICYPFAPLEGGLGNVTGSFTTRPLERTSVPQDTAWLRAGLGEASVPLSASLGQGNLTIQEFIHLRSGDVVRLQARLSDPVTVEVAGRPKFLGRPGRSDRKMAVEILHRLEMPTGGRHDG